MNVKKKMSRIGSDRWSIGSFSKGSGSDRSLKVEDRHSLSFKTKDSMGIILVSVHFYFKDLKIHMFNLNFKGGWKKKENKSQN